MPGRAPATFGSAFRGTSQTFTSAFTGNNRPLFASATEARIRRNSQRTVDAGRQFAKDAEGYMRRYAPWRDRSGEARKRLEARVETTTAGRATRTRVTLLHGVFYGRFLELANAGAYAILRPTRDALVPGLRRLIRSIWAASGGGASVRSATDVSSRFNPKRPAVPWHG